MKQILRNWMERYFYDPQVFILIFLLILGFVFIFWVGDLLIPVFAGGVIAYLLDGMVIRLNKWHVPRNISVLVVFVIFMIVLIIMMVGLFPLISSQIGQLLHELPVMVESARSELMLLPERYPELVSASQVEGFIRFISSELTRLGQHIFSISVASVKGFISILVYLVLVPLLVFFFLKDKLKILQWIKSLLPEHRGLAKEVWHELNDQIGNYIRGKIWEIIIIWTASYITFSFLKLNFSMLLSFFVGLSVLVPYIGVTVMFLPVALMAFFQFGLSADAFYIVLAYTIIQLLDGNLLSPLLLSEVVNIHPVAIIVAVLIFGGIWGVWGLFFAIPLATLVHAVIRVWLSRHGSKETVPDQGNGGSPE